MGQRRDRRNSVASRSAEAQGGGAPTQSLPGAPPSMPRIRVERFHATACAASTVTESLATASVVLRLPELRIEAAFHLEDIKHTSCKLSVGFIQVVDKEHAVATYVSGWRRCEFDIVEVNGCRDQLDKDLHLPFYSSASLCHMDREFTDSLECHPTTPQASQMTTARPAPDQRQPCAEAIAMADQPTFELPHTVDGNGHAVLRCPDDCRAPGYVGDKMALSRCEYACRRTTWLVIYDATTQTLLPITACQQNIQLVLEVKGGHRSTKKLDLSLNTSYLERPTVVPKLPKDTIQSPYDTELQSRLHWQKSPYSSRTVLRQRSAIAEATAWGSAETARSTTATTWRRRHGKAVLPASKVPLAIGAAEMMSRRPHLAISRSNSLASSLLHKLCHLIHL